MFKSKPIAGKSVSLRNMSASVSDDGRVVSLGIMDTPFPNLSITDAEDLLHVLGDVMDWEHDEDDN